MLTRNDIILALKNSQEELHQEFGVKKMVLFGSYAREQQTSESDIDVFVTMPAKMFLIVAVKQYIENLIGLSVDLIRDHRGLNEMLLKEIQRDGINIFECA